MRIPVLLHFNLLRSFKLVELCLLQMSFLKGAQMKTVSHRFLFQNNLQQISNASFVYACPKISVWRKRDGIPNTNIISNSHQFNFLFHYLLPLIRFLPSFIRSSHSSSRPRFPSLNGFFSEDLNLFDWDTPSRTLCI